MSTLLDLTQQGDVATITDESKLSSVKLMTPQQLYELWERQNWQSHTISFERDKEDWAGLSDADKDAIVWGLSSFFIGEERVATQFNGLVGAYESQAEEAFLCTQQVDEARHAQHFNRFYEQVIGYDGTFESRLDRAREDVSDAFKVLFDDKLVEANQRLLRDPGDREAKVDFVVTYHMVIEGTLALTGQANITDQFEQAGIMPGFLEGFRLISQDEHRHVAYGTWFLQQAAQDPALRKRIQARLFELIPIASGVLVPPGVDAADNYEIFGKTRDEVMGYAFTALTRRLKVIGVPLQAPDEEAVPA
ncbi:ribonucleotide-diphosphate reductase subunit beta [Conexibacter sp. SYSU D00693]|uniref:ribonucleotide-diphosphate reductase subunit beta n=1 Tax=Conexibacter sp. SYSU D00693 TaxID=2812560 RepID=UPI00196A34A9|nr:ribonucleotide-diphosphate reductase subunit beta [Conexibacter sp. SYSU D00693]